MAYPLVVDGDRRRRASLALLEIVEGAAHFLQEEKGEQIAERIVRFLGEP